MDKLKRFLIGLALIFSIGIDRPAADDFDAGLYAFELFSEDERPLSKYQNILPEEEMLNMLERSWAKLDDIAASTAGMAETDARRFIDRAVRGPGGEAEQFESALILKTQGSLTGIERLKSVATHPLVWILSAIIIILAVIRFTLFKR